MTEKIKVGIIGATGYAGAELFRLLYSHRNVEIAAVSSTSFEGKAINEVYPALTNEKTYILCDMDGVIEASDVIFAALPHGLSNSPQQVLPDTQHPTPLFPHWQAAAQGHPSSQHASA